MFQNYGSDIQDKLYILMNLAAPNITFEFFGTDFFYERRPNTSIKGIISITHFQAHFSWAPL